MKAKYIGQTDELCYINGKIYEVDCIMFNDCYVVEDEVGDFALRSKEDFEIVEGTEDELDVYDQDPKTFQNFIVKKGNKK